MGGGAIKAGTDLFDNNEGRLGNRAVHGPPADHERVLWQAHDVAQRE